MIECPIPLPWSSWNCHCPTLSASNNESLPICECGNTDTVQRSRIQLCAPSASSDQLTCSEIGLKMRQNHPGECPGSENQNSDGSTSNWYSQSDWRKIETSFIKNLTKAYKTFNEDGWSSDGIFKNDRYDNQCWIENNNRRETGKYFRINLSWILKIKYLRVRFRLAFEDCVRPKPSWNQWSDWSNCSKSCDRGQSERKRKCLLNNKEVNNVDCNCEGSDTDVRPCNTDCCPVWYVISSTSADMSSDTDSDALEIIQRNNSDRIWSSCPACGEAQTVSIRECKCRNQDNSWIFGDLNRLPFTGSSAVTPSSPNDHSCDLEYNEIKEMNSDVSFPYRAIKIKDCPEQPCCGGWTTWSNWAACESDCFFLSKGDPGRQEVTKTRFCGCKRLNSTSSDINIDESNCIGPDKEMKKCPERSPCPYWSEWSTPSACPVTCLEPELNDQSDCRTKSVPMRYQTRTCIRGNVGTGECIGETIKYLPCDDLPFCCLYSNWSVWNTCRLQNGLSCQRNEELGTHSRNRSVLCGSTNQNSNPCSDTYQTESCSLSACPGWTDWSNWTKCTVECGATGLKSRTRSCSEAEIGSKWCRCGASSPVISCVGCLTSDWSIMNKSETNISDIFIPGYHDESDLGYLQVEKCDACPYLSPDWSEWTSCSVTCDGGFSSRFRECIDGIIDLSEGCSSDDAIETKICSSESCVLEKWSEWNQWSICARNSASDLCKKFRERECSGNNCVGSKAETVTCQCSVKNPIVASNKMPNSTQAPPQKSLPLSDSPSSASSIHHLKCFLRMIFYSLMLIKLIL